MPVPGYRARRANPASQRRQVQAGQVGSALVDGLSRLGQTGSKIAALNSQVDDQIATSEFRMVKREQDRARSSHIADRAGALAEMQVGIAEELNTLRNDSEAGAYGYEGKAEEIVTKRVNEFESTLGDDQEVLNRFNPLITRWRGETILKEKGWSLQQRAGHEKEQIGKWVSTTANSMLDDWSPGKLTSNMEQAQLLVEGLDMPGNAKKAVVDGINREFVTTSLDHLIESDQLDAARAILSEGQFDSYLDASKNDKQAYMRKIGIVEKQMVRETELQQRKIQDAVGNEIDLVNAKIKAGITDIPDADLQKISIAAKASGLDPDEIFNLDALRVQIDVNRRYPTTGALRVGIEGLSNKVRLGQADEQDQIAIAHMKERYEELSEENADQYKERFAQGAGGRLSVASELAAMPIQERVATASKLDKGGNFRHAVQLPSGSMRLAIVGAEERKGNPDLVPVAKKLRGDFSAIIGSSGSGLSGSALAAVRDTAADIYAGVARDKGWKTFNSEGYRGAVSLALGRENGLGGLGSYRGQSVILPSGVSDEGLEQTISRFDFADASEMPEAIKSDFIPVWQNDDGTHTFYQFINDDGELLGHKDGGPYRLRVKAK